MSNNSKCGYCGLVWSGARHSGWDTWKGITACTICIDKFEDGCLKEHALDLLHASEKVIACCKSNECNDVWDKFVNVVNLANGSCYRRTVDEE